MQKTVCAAFEFLHAARGNWRNAMFIECSACPHESKNPCSGYLLISDADGKPIILPVDTLNVVSAKEECVAVLDRRQFESLYSLWIEWQVDSPEACPLRELSGSCDCQR